MLAVRYFIGTYALPGHCSAAAPTCLRIWELGFRTEGGGAGGGLSDCIYVYMYMYIYICVCVCMYIYSVCIYILDRDVHPPWRLLRRSPNLRWASKSSVTTKSQVSVQSTQPTPRTNRFTRALPPRGSRDPLRLAEDGALSCKGARHCPGFSLITTSPGRTPSLETAPLQPQPAVGLEV